MNEWMNDEDEWSIEKYRYPQDNKGYTHNPNLTRLWEGHTAWSTDGRWGQKVYRQMQRWMADPR